MKRDKSFDSVAMMRSSRDKIADATEGMTCDEEKQWLASQPLGHPVLRRLRDRIVRSASESPSSAER